MKLGKTIGGPLINERFGRRALENRGEDEGKGRGVEDAAGHQLTGVGICD